MPQDNISAISDALIAAGRLFHRRGWVPATGGNFSYRLGADRVLITASGRHKGELSPGDFMLVDADGAPLEARKASDETLLHTAIYRQIPTAGCVLHTHSVPATLLSRTESTVALEGYELLKILDGISTHECRVDIPVFENDQNISRLAAVVSEALVEGRGRHGFLIAGHGLYAWGESVPVARYRVEALEFLFDCVWQYRTRRQHT